MGVMAISRQDRSVLLGSEEVLDYYRSGSPMTSLDVPAEVIGNLPEDIAGLASVVQGVLLHEHWAPAYGQHLSDERRIATHTRSAAAMLEWLSSLECRPIETRMVGTCRNFSVLMVALLQAKGIPARTRCGFATYFVSGKYVDHWVAEYWNDREQRWVMVDAQLDPFQLARLDEQVNPLDVARSQFVVAGDAWIACRDGDADPTDFGILDMNGLWFVAGNLVRDLAALNLAPMLPWDTWGIMPEPEDEIGPDLVASLDRIALITSNPDAPLTQLRELYETADYQVPDIVFNHILQRAEPAIA
jgi:hypothetical protein